MSRPTREHLGRRELHSYAQKMADGRWAAKARVVDHRDESGVTLDHEIPIDHEPFATEAKAIAYGKAVSEDWSAKNPGLMSMGSHAHMTVADKKKARRHQADSS